MFVELCCGSFVSAGRIVGAADGAIAGVETRSRDGSRQAADADTADGGRTFQLQRAGISGIRDVALCDGDFGEERISGGARRGGSSNGLGGDVWKRQAGDCVYYGHLFHTAGLAEGGGGLSPFR